MKSTVPYIPTEFDSNISVIKNFAADMCSQSYSEVSSLCDLMLATPKVNENFMKGGRSGLNSDGTPLQFCISSKKEGWAGRFITDPASTYQQAEMRFSKSLDAINQLFYRTNSMALKGLFDEMVAFHLPKSKQVEDYSDGVFWIGAPVSGPGIAIYMDGRRGGDHIAWNRLKQWIEKIMPDIQELNPWISEMQKVSKIMSIGFEGSNLKNVRIKIYWRLKEAVLLDNLGCDLLKNDAFKIFLSDLAENNEMALNGMVFSLGIHLATQQFFDVKIDMCGCRGCLAYSDDKWLDKINYFTDQYGLAPFPIDEQLLHQKADISYFGMGLDIKGNKRLNLYLNSKLNDG
ncbi:MAG: hypothetical protein AAGA77_14030 [Bacteroidota bacterium]